MRTLRTRNDQQLHLVWSPDVLPEMLLWNYRERASGRITRRVSREHRRNGGAGIEAGPAAMETTKGETMNKAEILIRREILKQAIERGDLAYEGDIPDECVDEVYSNLQKTDSHWDYESEFRGGTHETDIPAEYSRHYESKSVARLIGDQWVGWTYWYGGGKHSEPESIEWIRDAYLLNCKETEKLVVCREWTKAEPNQ